MCACIEYQRKVYHWTLSIRLKFQTNLLKHWEEGEGLTLLKTFLPVRSQSGELRDIVNKFIGCIEVKYLACLVITGLMWLLLVGVLLCLQIYWQSTVLPGFFFFFFVAVCNKIVTEYLVNVCYYCTQQPWIVGVAKIISKDC